MYSLLQRQFAVMAFNAYRPSDENDIDLGSQGWAIDNRLSLPNRGDGFDATVYRSNTGQIVIAFRGTDPDNPVSFYSDAEADIEIGAGERSGQVDRALELVAEVISKYPGADIQFTGHSLGGGLASLMTVFFDRPAYIFAPAPFEYSAVNTRVDIDVINLWPPTVLPSIELQDSDLVQQYFTHYQRYQISQGRRDSLDPAFLEYANRFATDLEQGRLLYAAREQRVSGTYVNGEAVQPLRSVLPAIGLNSDLELIDIGNSSLSEGALQSIALHSMLLHTALVSAEQLPRASRNLPLLLELLLDKSLYAQGDRSTTPGFLNQLLNESFASTGSTTKIDQFADELLRLGTQGSTHIASLQAGLIASAVEHFHEHAGVAVPTFFQDVGDGVRFDFAALAASGLNKGVKRLRDGLDELLGPQEDRRRAGIAAGSSMFWTVQSGATGLNTLGLDQNEVQIGAPNSGNTLAGGGGIDLLIGGDGADTLRGDGENDVLLGRDGVDHLEGGEGHDYLSGGAEGDILEGGAGDDDIAGGAGSDTYVFSSGDGIDLITGDDNDGRIIFDGVELTGANARLSEYRNVLVEEINGQTFYYGRFGIGFSELRIAKSVEALTASEAVDRIAISAFRHGDLGIAFPVAIASDTTTLRENSAMQLEIALPEAAIESGFVRLASNTLASNMQVVTGAETLFFTNGYVDIPLEAGTQSLHLNLLATGDVDSVGGNEEQPVTLTAQIISSTGTPISDAGSLNVVFRSQDENHLGSTGIRIDVSGSVTDAWRVPYEWQPDETYAHPYFVGTEANELIFGVGIFSNLGPLQGDHIDGGAGDDFITGGGGADRLFGGDGNDYIRGTYAAAYSEGNNADLELQLPHLIDGNGWGLLDAGNGNYLPLYWTYLGYTPNELLPTFGTFIDGGAGNDDIDAGVGSDVAHGGAGNDRIAGGGRGDTILGEDGDDVVFGDGFDNGGTEIEVTPLSEHRADFIDGGAGHDHLYGQGGGDTIYGGSGNDELIGDDANNEPADDYLNGEDGDDLLSGGAGNDALFGGADNDQLVGDGATTDPDAEGDDQLDGGAGDDALFGHGGNDVLIGGDGADSLSGDGAPTLGATSDEDILDGGAGNDTLFGGRGADQLIGGSGNDSLEGDGPDVPVALMGDDTLDGGEGDDVLRGNGGSDSLSGAAGADFLFGGTGDDRLDGGDDDDQLSGEDGADTLLGEGGTDLLAGGDGDDTLDGGAGSDQLEGGAGDDLLISDGNNELLMGGAGNDTYIIDAGGGAFTVLDNEGSNIIIVNGLDPASVTAEMSGGYVGLQSDGQELLLMDAATFQSLASFGFESGEEWDSQTLQHSFTPGAVTSNNISLESGVAFSEIQYFSKGDDLILLYSGAIVDWAITDPLFSQGVLWNKVSSDSLGLSPGDQALVLTNWYRAAPGTYIDHLQDATLQTQDFSSLAASAVHIVFGSSEGDDLRGDAGGDDLRGYGGDDFLDGDAGDDSLTGGAGDDVLMGGEGDDVYLIGSADGADAIYDDGGTDTLRMGAGIAPTDISIAGAGSSIILEIGGAQSGNSIEILGANQFHELNIDRIEFSNGTVWDAAEIASHTGGDQRPTLAVPIADQMATAGQLFSLVVGQGAFTDANAGDTLTLSAELADAQPLPAWLSFDPGTRTFSGTPPLGTSGTLQISLYATDSTGLYASDSFELMYAGTVITGTAGDDVGSSALNGTGLGERLEGLAGNDVLRGNGGNDIIVGGLDDDDLYGGSSDDTFIFNRGDGRDRLFISDATSSDFDTLSFGPGISASDLVLSTDGSFGSSLALIQLRSADGSMSQDRIELPEYQLAANSDRGLSRITFADHPEQTLTRAQIDAMLMVPSEGNDYLRGTSGDDVLNGLGGLDTINGLAGDDVLDGGSGSGDNLAGGAGNDTYIINRGASQTSLLATGSAATDVDTLRLGAGILPSDLRVAHNGDTLWVTIPRAVEPTSTFFIINDEGDLTKSGTNIDLLEFVDLPGVTYTIADLRSWGLTGTSGDDFISGYTTDDLIQGGHGNDRLLGDAGADTYAFAIGDGSDTITDGSGANRIKLADGILPANVALYRTSSDTVSPGTIDADSLVVVVNGGQDQIWLERYFAASAPGLLAEIEFGDGTIWNNATIQANIVNLGGTGNQLDGTAGDDTHVVDFRTDFVSEAAGGGTDTVMSSVTHDLHANVENLTLTGVLNINGSGNNIANTILGNSGSNILQGGGNFGGEDGLVDTLIGGTGDDTYVTYGSGGASGIQDSVIEAVNEGYDTLIARSTQVIMPSNVEALLVRTGSNSSSQSYVGNALDNLIDASTATASGNGFTIDGGVGADVMIGPESYSFSSNVDRTIRFIVDNAGDVVISNQTGLAEVVRSSISYTLPKGIEGLELTGTGAIAGTGNSANNLLVGTLSSGANVLTGGLGDDTYLLGVGDSAVENAGEGLDVISFDYIANPGNSYSVDTYANFEGIQITNNAAAAVTLIGNAVDNILIGNNFANTISGGDGNDQITGGSAVNNLNGGAGNDTIVSGNSGDTIDGGSGNDVINAGGGSNTIYAGDGNDVITSSSGTDRFYGFTLNSGQDVITDTGGSGIVQFDSAENVNIEQAQFSRVSNDLRMQFSANSSITVKGWYTSATNKLAQLRIFYQGVELVYSAAHIQGLADGINTAPIVSGGDSDQAYVGEGFSHEIPLGLFIDIESQHSLTYTATLSGGDPLPTWLSLDSASRTFIGTPTAGSNGFYEIEVTATDEGGLSATTSFSLDVVAPPILGTVGPDVLNGDADGNEMYGLDGDDIMSGDAGEDQMFGGLGDDEMHGGDDNDYLVGDEGNDLIFGDTGNDSLAGSAGNDELHGGDDYDFLTGEEGDDTLFGDGADDEMYGGEGNDYLDGGDGGDYMEGGAGDDVYIVGAPGAEFSDEVVEDLNSGVDEVRSSVAYTLGANVENLTLIGASAINGTGNSVANVMTGNSAVNTLIGGSGDDTLDGGSAGNDILNGGQGNDTFIVNRSGLTLQESTSQGTDTVLASITFTLATNFENLTLTGLSAINGTGNTAGNTITGNSANNTLNAGTAGTDILIGGAGDDTYVINHAGVTVTEVAGQGADLVQSTMAYTLSAEVENLTLTGSGAVNGTGNSSNNALTGNSGSNTLAGGDGDDTLNPGTAGTDLLQGGLGNDTYIVGRSSGITVTESAGQGTDTVQASVTYTLGSNVENLTLTGSGAVNGTGNTGSNVITGNSGNNTLAGGDGNDTLDAGSAGTDSLQGGLGDDTFIYTRSSGVTLVENASAGTDTVQSSLTFTLATNFENLTLTGTSAINGTGNAANNVIVGNSASNTLDGGSGDDTLNGMDGTDTLTGGLGADTYQYTSGGGADIINNVAADSLIDRLVFTDLASTQIAFSRTGNNLVMTRVGVSTDVVTVTNWFSATANRLDFVNFTNRQVTAAEVDTLVNGGGGSFPLSFRRPVLETFAQPETKRSMLIADVRGTAEPEENSYTDLLQEMLGSEHLKAMTLGGKSSLEDILHPRLVPIKDHHDADVGHVRLINAMSTFGAEAMTVTCALSNESIAGGALEQLAATQELSRSNHAFRNEWRALAE